MGLSPEDSDGRLRVVGDEWSRALAGLTNAQIADGLQACRLGHGDWPPSANQFRESALRIPSVQVVRDEIAIRAHSPFTLLVLRGGVDCSGARWSGLDWSRYRSEKAVEADRLLAGTWARARDHVMRGGALAAESSGAIEHEVREFTPADSAQVEAHIAQIARLFGAVADGSAR